MTLAVQGNWFEKALEFYINKVISMTKINKIFESWVLDSQMIVKEKLN